MERTNRQDVIARLIKQANVAETDAKLLLLIAGEFFDAFNNLKRVAEVISRKDNAGL